MQKNMNLLVLKHKFQQNYSIHCSPYAEVESVGNFCPLNHLAPSSTTPFDDPKNRGWISGGVVGPSQMTLKVTLLSAPVSSELPFCKTTVLRKQLISPILFGRSKIGKKGVVLHSLGKRKICKSQCFLLGWLCKLFFKPFY